YGEQQEQDFPARVRTHLGSRRGCAVILRANRWRDTDPGQWPLETTRNDAASGACATSTARAPARRSDAAEHQRPVGPAEAEAVRHHRAQHGVGALAQDREALGPGVEF